MKIEKMSDPFKVHMRSNLIHILVGKGGPNPIKKPKPKVVGLDHPIN
jgi:hypothetical protein